MRIITLNANGIRSAQRKGFFEWLQAQQADVVCIQETKAQQHQLTDPCFRPLGYQCQYVDAVKPGYSGVAIYMKQPPRRIITALGVPEFDTEGRYVEAQFDDCAVVSVYLPSGSSGEARQDYKYRCLEIFAEHLSRLRRRRREYVLCGDWNIAHKQIDLKNWRSNQKNSGFLPAERAWMDELFTERGFVDAFRQVNDQPDQYTWWSNRGKARENNVGWRIDYHVITPGLADKVRAAEVYTGAWFSDHAPLTIDYDHTL